MGESEHELFTVVLPRAAERRQNGPAYVPAAILRLSLANMCTASLGTLASHGDLQRLTPA